MNKLTLPLLFSLPALGFAAALPLANPGFENSTDEWSFGDAGMSSVSDKAARSGEYGLLVEDQSGAKGSSVRSARLPVEPGKSYQVDFSAKIIGGGGIAVYLEFYDAKGKALTSSKDRTQVLRVIPPQLDGWKEYSVAGTAPEGTATVAVWVHSFSGNTVTAAFDDFSVQEVPASAVKEHPSSQSAASKSAAAQPAWTGRSEDLPSFEKKDPAAAFPEMKVYQPDGSAFRQPKEDWEQARQKVKDDPEWAKWYAAKKKEVDAWMAHNKDRAEWEAGWNHEFISPHDNAFLVWTDRVPGEEVDHFMSKTGDRVEITPKLFRAWVGAFRKNHASMMIEAGMLYRLTQDEKYAEWVAAQLDFYADNYMAWEKGVAKRANSWLGYQSLDDAVIISRQADAARLVFDYAGKDRRQNWYENLFKPEAILLGKTFQNIHNIATWQRATQVKIALLYGDKELLKESMDGGRGLRQQFERGVTGEYVWYEQSMGYNGFIIMATESLFTTAALIGEGDAVRREAEIAENLMLAPLSLRFPDGTIPNPADNTGVPRTSVTGLAQV
ncbi:MAG: carbohydrate binding domain-containing protein, partial [Puniceicoccales bacterium]